MRMLKRGKQLKGNMNWKNNKKRNKTISNQKHDKIRRLLSELIKEIG